VTAWGRIKAEFPDGIPVESPLFIVTKTEDIGSGTIRV
jgi:hypothetical protein